MEILALTIFIVFSLAGFILIFFTTFGTLIILIGEVLFALMTRLEIVGIKTLLIILGLYLIGEFFEYIFIVLGVKKTGASNLAVLGALIGAIVGAALGTTFFGIGILPGTLLGIFFGAFLVQFLKQRDFYLSLKAGAGGLIGRLGSIVSKVIIAFLMIGLVVVKLIK